MRSTKTSAILRQKQSLTKADICLEFLGGCSPQTFVRMQSDGRLEGFPAPFSFGNKHLYKRSDVQSWFDEFTAKATEAA